MMKREQKIYFASDKLNKLQDLSEKQQVLEVED